MQMNQVQDSLNRIEQCADDAVAAMRNTSAPDELRQRVDDMHRQAREVRSMAQQSTDQSQLAGRVDSLEETGDRAKKACRDAGSGIDAQLQSAVIRTHDEIASLKRQMH